MHVSKHATTLITSLALLVLTLFSSVANASCDPLLEFETNKLHSQKSVNFCEQFNDKVLLVVNTASHCGYTPQFKELEGLYQKYKDQGLEIVGFPSNDFRQEYKSEEQTASVCYINYGVSFTMVSTSSVKGESKNSFYQKLTDRTGKEPGWNFSKFLISKDRKNIEYFRSATEPMDSPLEALVAQYVGRD
ncbi:glutathione peroxidase [Alkalimarinus sediminis]|uniref:Glutathione peroxidase n=1 Tax=Alkalimarinus sediminis TaxID=1632866 RepID=A0A9E8HLE8_9ALTE|nr:glutathione peroxidase [Alkalimarinus sediminis]UZW74853.1 glutathione peroxidase [Alkalimarinus sediminis]